MYTQFISYNHRTPESTIYFKPLLHFGEYIIFSQGYQVNSPDTRFTRTEVNIEITDINDNRPSMSRDVYTAHVQEHLANGSVVLTVTATDLDEVRSRRGL